ncbi:hypothetical protein GUITHDRAFT_133942 [Guillardia theta CCMP2712]|uniref:MPN domain-containing protein n=2 Tax=Guillardia theta TaxID=55529 RepID=L1JVK0_GUITC|nr:hypothetical protein GUITHDRAFT_133942 [Guillardia theta CCMP2712]EKX52230.1 hypothetical protein GUITHDRAFT_133942 [Guillardia theta CCMP2712]|eukprot:XP_005839210.1 hypothetical protein GUITHDRAFT_133942 [Guillardia theta CCMP2712]
MGGDKGKNDKGKPRSKLEMTPEKCFDPCQIDASESQAQSKLPDRKDEISSRPMSNGAHKQSKSTPRSKPDELLDGGRGCHIPKEVFSSLYSLHSYTPHMGILLEKRQSKRIGQRRDIYVESYRLSYNFSEDGLLAMILEILAEGKLSIAGWFLVVKSAPEDLSRLGDAISTSMFNTISSVLTTANLTYNLSKGICTDAEQLACNTVDMLTSLLGLIVVKIESEDTLRFRSFCLRTPCDCPHYIQNIRQRINRMKSSKQCNGYAGDSVLSSEPVDDSPGRAVEEHRAKDSEVVVLSDDEDKYETEDDDEAKSARQEDGAGSDSDKSCHIDPSETVMDINHAKNLPEQDAENACEVGVLRKSSRNKQKAACGVVSDPTCNCCRHFESGSDMIMLKCHVRILPGTTAQIFNDRNSLMQSIRNHYSELEDINSLIASINQKLDMKKTLDVAKNSFMDQLEVYQNACTNVQKLISSGLLRHVQSAVREHQIRSSLTSQSDSTNCDLNSKTHFLVDNGVMVTVMDLVLNDVCNESIGFLYGMREDKKVHIKSCRLQERDISSLSRNTVHLKPEWQHTTKYAGFEVVGWFHSHLCDNPSPSSEDWEMHEMLETEFDRPLIGMICCLTIDQCSLAFESTEVAFSLFHSERTRYVEWSVVEELYTSPSLIRAKWDALEGSFDENQAVFEDVMSEAHGNTRTPYLRWIQYLEDFQSSIRLMNQQVQQLVSNIKVQMLYLGRITQDENCMKLGETKIKTLMWDNHALPTVFCVKTFPRPDSKSLATSISPEPEKQQHVEEVKEEQPETSPVGRAEISPVRRENPSPRRPFTTEKFNGGGAFASTMSANSRAKKDVPVREREFDTRSNGELHQSLVHDDDTDDFEDPPSKKPKSGSRRRS